ncbi:YceD family protein [Canibacter zhuwentaonis]|uniref:YceD family protein n=1 Tax=Canibacter zhuwentaonis TaxID=2837491 RepID=UPI0032B5F326
MSKKHIFRFNIRDIYNRPGQMRELTHEAQLTETWGEGISRVKAGAEVGLQIRFESVHEGILATVRAATEAESECARCLKNFTQDIKVDFTELFAYNLTEDEEYGVRGDQIDLEFPLRDAVVLALPFTPVCDSDCEGLDPATGEPYESGVAVAKVPEVDPRWAALADFSIRTGSKN